MVVHAIAENMRTKLFHPDKNCVSYRAPEILARHVEVNTE